VYLWVRLRMRLRGVEIFGLPLKPKPGLNGAPQLSLMGEEFGGGL
jgi:hypothetical protein